MVAWNKVLEMQKKLDEVIYRNAGITRFPIKETKIALLVEIGELANEVQDFKYWKKHKNVDKKKVLEEWADCMHFAASIYNFTNNLINIEFCYGKIEIIDIFKEVMNFNSSKEVMILNDPEEFNVSYIAEFLISYGVLNLGFTEKELFDAYCKKNKKNYERQREGY